MYNSLFVYALKTVKSSLIYSIVLIVMFSQIISLSAIYILIWSYEIKFLDSINFIKYISFFSFFIAILIITISMGVSTSMYVFSENGRIFSTLRIFGARKKELIKLIFLQMLIYSLTSFLVSLIELTVLYIRYEDYIYSIYSDFNFVNSLIIILPVFSIIIFVFIFISVLSSIIFIQKDPYESMRGTL